MQILKFIVNILFCAISLTLFFIAPNIYSYFYCLIILFVFIIFNFIFFSLENKKEGVSFEFIFMISFFMTNFVYPVFYFPNNPTISLFNYSFDYNVITKSTALALIAYSFYILGVTQYKKNNIIYNYYNFYIGTSNIIFLLIVSSVSFLMFVLFGGLDTLRDVYNGRGAQINAVNFFSYFLNIFEISCLLLSIFVFQIKNNPLLKTFTLVFLAFTLLMLLSTGSRVLAIGNVIVLLVSYSKNVKKISLIIASFWALLGANFLYFIMLIRSLGIGKQGSLTAAYSEFSSSRSHFDPFMDLIINNRNLYVLTDFVDANGYVYFFNIIYNLISFLPFNSIIINILNIPYFLQQGNLPTYLEFGHNPNFGLGTNMVGEAYLSFGMLGIFITFYGLGIFVKFIKKRSYQNIYYYVLFFIFVSMVVILPRAVSVPNLRNIIWPLILIFIVISFNRFLMRNGK